MRIPTRYGAEGAHRRHVQHCYRRQLGQNRVAGVSMPTGEYAGNVLQRERLFHHRVRLLQNDFWKDYAVRNNFNDKWVNPSFDNPATLPRMVLRARFAESIVLPHSVPYHSPAAAYTSPFWEKDSSKRPACYPG